VIARRACPAHAKNCTELGPVERRLSLYLRLWALYFHKAEERSVDDWDQRAKDIPAELDRVILKRVNKHYRPTPTLVVYLNLNEYGIWKGETEGSI
jgi:hypothetical protein